MTFSDWFKQTRTKKGQTLTQVAETLEIAISTVSRWEQGAEPRVAHLHRITEWGAVSSDFLLALFETP